MLKRIFWFLHRRYFTRYGFFGPYASWKDAQKVTTGYDSDVVFRTCTAAAEAVLDGRAVFERDSHLFHEAIYSWPLLTALNIVAQHHETVHVLDFGGGPGSTYMQHRPLLPEGTLWSVVEQAGFVEWGQAARLPPELRFYSSFDKVDRGVEPNVAVLS